MATLLRAKRPITKKEPAQCHSLATVKDSKGVVQQDDGVFIDGMATANFIGIDSDGSTGDANEWNLISGNSHNGVRISGDNTDSNIVAGNRIGTKLDGKGALANTKDGVRIENKASVNRIGTGGNVANAVFERNVISGNKQNGVRISGKGTDKNIVAGNWIGVQIDKTSKLGNLNNGVRIEGNASTNRIGGENKGTSAKDKAKGNIIAFNGAGFKNKLQGHGVVVASANSKGNSIRMNSIFGNTGRGIDLGDDSFTINDPAGDKDAGANGLQDYPVVRRVLSPTKMTWMLDSTAKTNFYIDFYSNTSLDPSGFGEGKTYLYTVEAKTDGKGRWQKDVNFAVGTSMISATATNRATGDTSESSMIDTDGDALADAWETIGIDINEDGWIDHKLNSNPRHLDIFVEVDAMTEDINTNGILDPGEDVPNGFLDIGEDKNANGKLDPGEDVPNGMIENFAPVAPVAGANSAITAFANVPNALLNNPDGMNGITLHAFPVDDNNIPAAVWTFANRWANFDTIKNKANGGKGFFGTNAERAAKDKAGNSNWVNVRAAKS